MKIINVYKSIFISETKLMRTITAHLALLFVIFYSIPAFATQKVSKNPSGTWEVAADWEPVGVPIAGDTLTIQAGHNMAVTANNDLTAAPTFILVYGTLDFSNPGAKLRLACGSGVYIAPGGLVTSSGGGGGAANQITICGVEVWRKADGDQSGPLTWGTIDAPLLTLPVELVSFEATAIDNTRVELIWITATEINNDYFTLERSSNGISWIEIAQINGAGNSSSELHYEYYDNEPLNGTSYYRLSQTDFNGDSETFDIKAVDITTVEEGQCVMTVYPNPCNAQCNVVLSECPENAMTDIVVQVIDASGNVVQQEMPYRNYDGSFAYSIDKSNNLKPGIYFVRGVSNEELYTEQVVIQ